MSECSERDEYDDLYDAIQRLIDGKQLDEVVQMFSFLLVDCAIDNMDGERNNDYFKAILNNVVSMYLQFTEKAPTGATIN